MKILAFDPGTRRMGFAEFQDGKAVGCGSVSFNTDLDMLDRMPQVYRSPASKLKKGHTNYLVPVGGGTIFSSREGVKIKEITDGSVHTIMAVEVDDQHTVIWTKPQDLPFDPKRPDRGLGGVYEGGFLAVTCDGAAHFLSLPQDAANLRALFLYADGGVAEIK